MPLSWALGRTPKKKLVVTTDSGRLNPRASVPGRRHAGPGFMTAGSGRAGWGTTQKLVGSGNLPAG